MPDIVAVENIGVVTHTMQFLFNQIGDRGFPCPGQTGKPEHARFLSFQRSSCGLVDVEVLDVNVVRAA